MPAHSAVDTFMTISVDWRWLGMHTILYSQPGEAQFGMHRRGTYEAHTGNNKLQQSNFPAACAGGAKGSQIR